MRTFQRCYPTQRWQIFRHYEPDIHFFVSVLDDEQADSVVLLEEHYPKDHIHAEKWKDPVLPEIPIEFGAHAPYANAATHEKLLLQHWGNLRCWNFFNSVKTHDFDTIIRIRPDIFIHRFMPPYLYKPILNPYLGNAKNMVYCPWWGKFGGVNDRLSVMGIHAAKAYFETFNHIKELVDAGCPFHPETLVYESMKLAGVDIRSTLLTSFSTLRMNGSQRWPEQIMDDFLEAMVTLK